MIIPLPATPMSMSTENDRVLCLTEERSALSALNASSDKHCGRKNVQEDTRGKTGFAENFGFFARSVLLSAFGSGYRTRHTFFIKTFFVSYNVQNAIKGDLFDERLH